MEPNEHIALPPRCGSEEETRTWTTAVLGPYWDAYCEAICKSFGMIGKVYLDEMNRVMREYLPCAELDRDATRDLLKYIIGDTTEVRLGAILLNDGAGLKLWVPQASFKFSGILGDVYDLQFRVESLGSLPRTGDADGGYVFLASFPKQFELGPDVEVNVDPFDSERHLVELCYWETLESMERLPAPIGVMMTLSAMLSLEKPALDILNRMLVLCENWSFEISKTQTCEIDEATYAVADYMRKRDRVARGLEEE